MKTYSLTRRLISAVLLVQLASSLGLVAVAGVYEGVTHFRAFDIMLRGRADSLLGAVQDAEDPDANVMLDGTQLFVPSRDIWAVRDDRGVIIGQSPNWPDAARMFESPGQQAYRGLKLDGRHYRVIRIAGLRMVDPDRSGGIARHVVIFYGSRTHVVWELIGRAVGFYAAASLLLLAFTGWIMFRLLRRGLAPLHDLAAQASGISVRAWHFEPANETRSVAELAPLVTALETALARLERSFAQQTQFVSDAAHELKTSLAVLKSSLQLLTLRPRSVPEYASGLARVESDCERMEEVVAGMLTLARVEAQDNETCGESVELGQLLTEVVAQFQPLSDVSQVHIRLSAPHPVSVVGDREGLRLVCSNLLHNALQHSHPGGEVRALVSADGLRIEDDGEGMEPEVLEHVFDRFYRGDPSRSRRTGGTGLGLAISRAIIQRAGGEITLESTPGRGTSAIVRLRLAVRTDGSKLVAVR